MRGVRMAKLWGWWTRHKLQILEDYLSAFVLASSSAEERIYLDLFAGWPENASRESDEQILGSVHRALRVTPPSHACACSRWTARRSDSRLRSTRPIQAGAASTSTRVTAT